MILFGYFGPEVMMPLASAVAAVGGAIMMFGRRSWMIGKRAVRSIQAVFKRS